MKKISLIISILIINSSVFAESFYQKDWFEPVTLCAVVGAGGYLAEGGDDSSRGLLFAAGGCAFGALLGVLVNKRYKVKHDKEYQGEVKALQGTIRQLGLRKKQNGYSRDLEENGYFIEKEVIPSYMNDNGEIVSPRIKYKLKKDEDGGRIGR